MQGRGYYSGGGQFSLTPMIKYIMMANAVVWVLELFTGGNQTFMVPQFGVSWVGVIEHSLYWQPFTYMWLHSPDNFMHILFNMFALWMFGSELERLWGSERFLRFYLICGIGAGFIILFWNGLMGGTTRFIPTVGASGAIYGVLIAFSLTWPDRTVMLLFPPIPMKAIWLGPMMIGIGLLLGGGDISHAGHLGGALIAALLMRSELTKYIGFSNLRYKFHRFRMRRRLRAVRDEEWERRRKDDDDRPTFH